MPVRRLLWFLLVITAAPLSADPPGVFAITGGTVHPVSGPSIANGVVVVRDGLIEAVGAGLAVPADAAVIDAKNGHVYPGLIDAQTSAGFAGATPAPRRRGAGTTPSAPPPAETGPAFASAHELKLADDDLTSWRAIGVTTLLTAPATGIFNGQSVILNLGEGAAESRAIRASATQQISFNRRPAWTYPDSLMGVVSFIRQTLLDAQQNAAAQSLYDRNPAGLRRPDDRPDLAALGAALHREVPVVFVADSELMMRRALAIAREFNLRPIISGGQQAYRMAGDLKTWGTPVLVSVKWPAPPASQDDASEQPLRVIRDRQLSPTTPAVLASRGVPFALVSGGGKSTDFLPGIRKAIENGLAVDDALRSVTLSPARILGIDRQTGSIEKGKIANLVITDQPIFSKDAHVTRMLIDGREISLLEGTSGKSKRGSSPETPAEAGAGKASVDGSWSLTVKTNEGDVSINVSLHAEGGQLTGTYSGDRGSGDIHGGRLDGSTVGFSISARLQAETSDWAFQGTVSGGSMSGTVSGTGGTFSFQGSKAR